MTKLVAVVVEAGSMAGASQPTVDIDQELVLRPFADRDAKAVVEAYTTPDIQRFHFHRFDTEREAQSWIAECGAAWASEEGATWAVVDRDSDAVLGRVTIYTDLKGGRGEVSYWTLPTARGRAVATRACVAATGWAHELGLQRVQLQHSADNSASRRVAQRAGFIEEGIRRSAVLHADGWHDMVVYSRLLSDET